MKIALILSSPPGYSETFFRSKIKGLQENGHQVTLVTARSKTDFNLCTHKTHPKVYQNALQQVFAMLWVGLSLLPYFGQVKAYYQLEKQEGSPFKRIIEKIYINATLLKLKVDWLHFGFATMAIDRELAAQAVGAKMAVSFRGYDINVFALKNEKCYQKVWKHVNQVHSISQFLLNRAYQIGLSKDLPCQIITPAVDCTTLPKPEFKQAQDKIKILTVARLHYIKGIDNILQTAKHLKKSCIDFEWQVIGDGKKEDFERYLYHRYALGLEDEVKFIGRLNHAETLKNLVQSDLYVQTSLIEGFCNAVLEAQALGKISIAFDTGALSENIENGVTGFLVKTVDAKLLARKIIDVITLRKDKKQKIQEQAQERVKNSFNLQQQKEAFHLFYTEANS